METLECDCGDRGNYSNTLSVESDLYYDSTGYWAEDPITGGLVVVRADNLPVYADGSGTEYTYDANLKVLTPLKEGYEIVTRPGICRPDYPGSGW